MDQTPYVSPFPLPVNPFSDNPEPRCASLIIVDVSGSMDGEPLKQLQAGLANYRQELLQDNIAKKRVEIAVVTFGDDVKTLQDFDSPENMQNPILMAAGPTPMGAAIVHGLQLLEARKQQYKANGIMYYRPWVFLITDGAPTDFGQQVWQDAITKVRDGETKKAFSFYAVGIEGADLEKLKEVSVRAPVMLKGLQFKEMFKWLSASQKSVSQSKTTDQVPLKNPTTPDGWATAG